MMRVEIYSDGACSKNPGPGAFATILKIIDDTDNEIKDKEIVYVNGFMNTTNNQMELSGVIKGLKLVGKLMREEGLSFDSIKVFSDSQYVTNAINKRWLYSWEKNDWKKWTGQPVKNENLWKELSGLLKQHKAKFIWIKGHDGHPENERCDKLAVEYYTNMIKDKNNQTNNDRFSNEDKNDRDTSKLYKALNELRILLDDEEEF
jgi:ribonuclease HI